MGTLGFFAHPSGGTFRFFTDRDHPVTPLLRKDPEWVYIYSDPAAFVFVRNSPGQKHLLKRFKDGELLPPNSPSTYFPG